MQAQRFFLIKMYLLQFFLCLLKHIDQKLVFTNICILGVYCKSFNFKE